MRDIPVISPLLHAFTFMGKLDRVTYGIWLGIICLGWVVIDPRYHWMQIPRALFEHGNLLALIVLALMVLWVSAMVRRLRDTSWRVWWVTLPLIVLALPYFAWALMVVPAMAKGATYLEAMRAASQDGGIQIIVTGAGKISPKIAWCVSCLLALLPSRPRSPQIETA